MIFVIIGIVLLICICVAVSGSNKKQEKLIEITEKNSKLEATAKRPEALQRLLREEFPTFADTFTYGKCEQALKQDGILISTRAVSKHKKFMSEKWKSEKDREGAQLAYARAIAPIFSQDLLNFAEANSTEFYSGFQRALSSSQTLSKS